MSGLHSCGDCEYFFPDTVFAVDDRPGQCCRYPEWRQIVSGEKHFCGEYKLAHANPSWEAWIRRDNSWRECANEQKDRAIKAEKKVKELRAHIKALKGINR